MNAPRRLVDSSESDLARALVRAGSDERPTEGAMGKTLVALGIGTAVAATTATAGAAAGGGATTTVAKTGLGALVTKIGIAVFVATAATAGTVRWVRGRASHETTTQTATETRTQPTQGVMPPTTAPTPSAYPPMPDPTPLSATTEAPVPSAAATTAAPAKASTSASLTNDLTLMESARKALASGNTTACLAALDRYDHDHPNGAFAQEVVVIRIEALMKRGDRATAKALADRFLAAHPSSPYSARIKSLVKDASNP